MTSLDTLERIWNARPGGLLFSRFAEALHEQGRIEEAVRVLQQGLQNWPNHLSGRILLGRYAAEKGDLEIARQAFLAATELDASSWNALQGLAECQTRLQFIGAAMDTWTRLSYIDAKSTVANQQLEQLRRSVGTQASSSEPLTTLHEEEDLLSREALGEGASTGAGLRGSASAPRPQDSLMAFGDINSTGLGPILNESDDPLGMDELRLPMDLPSAPTAPSASSAMKTQHFEDSNFATLEMSSYPGKVVLPPPLELPKAEPLAAGIPEALDSATREFTRVPGQSPEMRIFEHQAATPKLDDADVTGNDIGLRFDELFGTNSEIDVPPAAPPSAPTAVPAAPLASMGGMGSMGAMLGMDSEGDVTGDDIENRLDALFGDAEIELASATSIQPISEGIDLPLTPPAGDNVTGTDIEDRLDALFADVTLDTIAPPPPPAALLAEKPVVIAAKNDEAAVTGVDIEDRLNALFGDFDEAPPAESKSVSMPVAPAPVPTAVAATPASLVPEAPLEDDIFDFEEAGRTTMQPIENAPVSGRDVVDRLDVLFGDDDSAQEKERFQKAGETSAVSISSHPDSAGDVATMEGLPTYAPPFAQSELSATSFQAAQLVGMALEPSDVDSGGSTLDLPALPPIAAGSSTRGSLRLTHPQDVDSELDELFASSEFGHTDNPPPAPRPVVLSVPELPSSAALDLVTGDDVEDRLDDLFGPESDFPVGMPTVTLAEEYLRQGYKDQAAAVYRQLLSRDPANKEIALRLADIESQGI